jgi:uncharacterized membrane protein
MLLSSRSVSWLLTGLLLVALLLRLYRLTDHGIFFDEKSTLLVSQGVCLEGSNQRDVFSRPYFSPAQFWKPKTYADFVEANARGDFSNSPAYYALLSVWERVFGLSDGALRGFSVLFGLLTVWLVFVFVWRHFGGSSATDTGETGGNGAAGLALLAVAGAVVEPLFVAHSHIARTYTLTFFLTLLATHLFVLIYDQARRRQPAPGWLYPAYGLALAASLLAHYLTLTVFVAHGLFALTYLRRPRAWLTLLLTGAAGLVLVSTWFVFGAGQYLLHTLDYQAHFYRNIALTNPTGTSFGPIYPATLPNVARRAWPIFTDLLLLTNGLGTSLIGVKNSLLALLLGGLLTGLIHRYRADMQPPVWVKLAPVGLLLATGLLVTAVPERFLVLTVSVPMVYLMGRYALTRTSEFQRRIVLLLLLLSLIPTLFLVMMAFRAGHTFGLTQRYSGFSLPFTAILLAMGLRELVTLRWWFLGPLGAVLLLQTVWLGRVLGGIYADTEAKYTFFGIPRQRNPHWIAAQKINASYAPGDTVLYPNVKREVYSKMDETRYPVSLLDAQLVNVYLPPTATFWQRIDPNEPNRIVLVQGKTGKKTLIFDLKDVRY